MGDKAIYKRVYVQFDDKQNANKFVESLNNKIYKKHKLSATWTSNRSDTKQFMKKSTFLKCVGFPMDITKNKVLQFLYQQKPKSIEPININLNFKYSLVPEIF